jgi:hypothetical protein
MVEKGTLLEYLFTVTTHKFEITATILITNILLIWRVEFMEIGCKGYASEKRLGTAALETPPPPPPPFWIIPSASDFISFHLFHIPLILYRCGTSHVYI